MSRLKSFVVATTLLASAAALRPAFGEGGYFAGGVGVRAAGRSGAFTARADDVTALTFNPAGLAKLGTTVIQVGDRSSYNAYTFTRAPTQDWGNVQNGMAPIVSFDPAKNGTPWQAAEPIVGVASNLGLRDWGFAVAAFAPPGVSREEFPQGGGQRYLMVKREAIILNYTAGAAWKRGDRFGIGATVQWIHVPRLIYSLVIDGTPFAGAANPVSSPLDMQATTTGSDAFAFNAMVGAWYRPTPSLELGLAGQIVPAEVATHSTLSIVPVDRSMGDSVLLTRNGVPANDVSVTLPLPLLARAAARYRGFAGERERYDIELDVAYETWSRVKRFTLDTGGLQANFQGQVIDLGRIDIDKQWRDTIAVMLGGDYVLVPDRWTVRGGLFYQTAVARAAYSNVDFPDGQQLGGSAGASFLFGRWEVAIAYQLRVQPSASVAEGDARVYQQVPGSSCQAPYTDPATCNPNYLGQPAPAVNAGTYAAFSHLLSLGLLYRYGR